MTEGCQMEECSSKFCRSNSSFPIIPKDVALVLAHSICGRVGKKYICVNIPKQVPEIPQFKTILQLQDSTASKLDQLLSNYLNISLFELGFNSQVPPMRIATVLNKIKKHPSDHLLKAHYSEGLLEKIAQANVENTTPISIPSPDSDEESHSSYSSSNQTFRNTEEKTSLTSSDHSFPSVSSISFKSHVPHISKSLENMSTETYGRRRSLSSGANSQVSAFRNIETVQDFITRFTNDRPIRFNKQMLVKMLTALGTQIVATDVKRKMYERKKSKRSSSWDELSQVQEKQQSFNKSKLEGDGEQQRSLLAKVIQFLFSDPLIMLSSFKTPSGIDYTALLECYNYLLSIEVLFLKQILIDSLIFLIAQLKTRSFVRHPFSWMICFLVASFPDLESLISKLFKSYHNLSFEQKQLFLKNVLCHPIHVNVIDATNEFIVKNAIVLSNEINDDVSTISKESTSKVSLNKALSFTHDLYVLSRYKFDFKCELFYNSVLGDTLDLKKEYKLHKKNKSIFLKHLYLFDPIAKTNLLQIQSLMSMAKEYEDACVNHAMVVHTSKILQESITTHELDKLLAKVSNPYCLLEVKREFIIEDVLQYKEYILKHKRKPLRVRFMDGEEGLDQGGVQKEFFLILVEAFMDPNRGLFNYNNNDRIAWLTHDQMNTHQFVLYELFGMMVGLASYNGILLDLHLPICFFKKLANESVNFEDFESTFPAIAKSCLELKENQSTDFEHLFCLNFNISYENVGTLDTYELIEDGSNVPVTLENKEAYIELFMNHKLNESIKNGFDAFYTGFWNTSGPLCKLFKGVELEKIITGAVAMDFYLLERHTKYEGYTSDQPYIRYYLLIKRTLENTSWLYRGPKKRFIDFCNC